MKRFLVSFIMAACIVGSLSAQETLDSLSYAMGDYFTRSVLDSQDKKTQQIKSDREEYIRGFSDGLNLYRQERTAASSYHEGQQMGLFFLMSINFEQIEEKDQPHLDCLIEGLRKVADNTVVLPQDTIGAHHLLLDLDDEAMLSMVYGDSCRIETTMGILLGLRDYDTLPPIDRDQGDSISIEDQQAFAAGMADVLESSNSEATYDMGRFAALFYFIDNMRMKQLLGLDFDYDAIIDGARGALELTERKMSVEEVELCLTQYYAAQYNIQAAEGLDYNDDIDDALLEEAARAAIEDVSREMAKNPNILQRYSLSGQVSVKGGKGKKSPAIGWTVTLDDGFMTTVTNQNGEYRFDDVPPGNYTIFYQDPFALERVFQVKLKNKDKKLDQTFNEDGSDYVSQAKRDIFMGRLQFQVISGDTPVYYTGEYCFDSFYERYGVQIVDWGDIIPCEPVVFANYNKHIFDYLDETFGDEWRSTEWLPILRTVEGFNQWHP